MLAADTTLFERLEQSRPLVLLVAVVANAVLGVTPQPVQ
jgi:hypothetical protein